MQLIREPLDRNYPDNLNNICHANYFPDVSSPTNHLNLKRNEQSNPWKGELQLAPVLWPQLLPSFICFLTILFWTWYLCKCPGEQYLNLNIKEHTLTRAIECIVGEGVECWERQCRLDSRRVRTSPPSDQRRVSCVRTCPPPNSLCEDLSSQHPVLRTSPHINTGLYKAT